MKKNTGFKYLVEGVNNIDQFAKNILTLINLKSSIDNTIVDIKTFKGTCKISITSIVEIDDFLIANVGKILDKDNIYIINLDMNDFNKSVQDNLNNLESQDKEYLLL